MALDEEPNAPGSFWTEIAQDQQAGTFKKCQCGEFSPGTYDTCHFCQCPFPAPDHVRVQLPGTVFTPTGDDMEACYGGVLVSSLAEGEEAVALTGDKREALEAIDTYYRDVCGLPNLLDDANARLTDAYYLLDCGYAVFTRDGRAGWQITPSSPTASGAVPVTWFRGAPIGPVPQPYTRRNDPQLWGPSL